MNYFAIWHNHKVIGYCKMSQTDADMLNEIESTVLYFGFDSFSKSENSK